jgi:hypothetical protein
MTKPQLAKNEPLEGQVATILTERELVINIGASHGVEPEMKFKVLAEYPTEVFDPETNERLGTVDREKVRVQATEVRERMSICRTYRIRYIPPGRWYDFSVLDTARLFAPPREIPETLKVDDSSKLPPLPEEQSYVKIGDRVIQLVEGTE